MKKIIVVLCIVLMASIGYGQQLLECVSSSAGLSVPSLSGQETILKSKGVFSFVNQKFQEWNLDQTGPPTDKTVVDVFKLKKDAMFAEVFSSLFNGKEKKVLTQHQIVSFAKDHQEFMNNPESQVFFFFQANGEYWVASLCARSAGRLTISPFKLDYDRSWHPIPDLGTEFYFVVPR